MFLVVQRTDTLPEMRALVNTDHVVAVMPVAGGVQDQALPVERRHLGGRVAIHPAERGVPRGSRAGRLTGRDPTAGARCSRGASVVTLEHVGKRYGAGAPILSDVSLRLEPGGFYFLTGASGAGKTTLLKLIYLAEPPSRGRVSLLGTDAATLDRAGQAALRRRIGIVFQDFRLLDELTAAENVALALRIAGVAERQIRANVPELLAWVGLADRGDSVAATLSGGERQRVAIARADRAPAGTLDRRRADRQCRRRCRNVAGPRVRAHQPARHHRADRHP